MDPSIQRELNDKLYDKRKVGALNLERIIREASANEDTEKVKHIIYQLCHEFAFAVHQPYARNGGLIGLAAASIALGPDVAQYLEEIVPPVLACFTDQDARVRYYACEAMYNIAKVAKGEILRFFNDVFDALSKVDVPGAGVFLCITNGWSQLAADSELSVKNGAELLDRLIKDIVSESASTYVSVLQQSPDEAVADSDTEEADDEPSLDLPTAFSLARFIPLLKERIYVINPFTRTFLVSWLMLLDSIPDLELVFYLPSFLGGLFKFLSDPNRDVHVATQGALERFLAEVKRIARIKRGIEESRKGRSEEKKRSPSADSTSVKGEQDAAEEGQEGGSVAADSATADDGNDESTEGDWIPGQDVHVDHPKILEILVTFLDSTSGNTASAALISQVTNDPHSEEEIQLTALRWIDSFFEICPEDILQFIPRLLSQVLPAMSSDVEQVRQAANRVNTSLMEYIISLSDQSAANETAPAAPTRAPMTQLPGNETAPSAPPKVSTAQSTAKEVAGAERKESANNARETDSKRSSGVFTPPPPPYYSTSPQQSMMDLDYSAAVNSLTLQFLNEHEATRIGALTWLIMLHKRAPRKVLAINDETFPALLKTLSDPAEGVVTRDLQLLSQISKNSEDSYFTSFMDVEFASIMVQNLNNNLITAPELSDLRKRLRNLETKDGQTFFVTLFRSWCHNAVATFSLCLLAQAYEQAYNLLQIFAELEMTVHMLIQIDKLVQLLESPVFTYLRLQLLEPERYPHLYKCLYGLLMLLPQSSAFAALKNRLNSVSAIGYLHIAPRPIQTPSTTTFERPNRLKGREEGTIRWVELLDKFKSVQEKAKRQQRQQFTANANNDGVPQVGNILSPGVGQSKNAEPALDTTKAAQGGAAGAGNLKPLPGAPTATNPAGPPGGAGTAAGHRKSKPSLTHFGRLSGAVSGKRGKR
ncbi:MAG: hypothetical protein M1837_003537 [Sclerophora amabilis]|nr:MAG: hypothetical protein M1837_003537 [Sclerophora amabilis]